MAFTYTWMRHPSFPAGQAALILDTAVSYWTGKGWTTTTADTLGTTPAAPITLTTLTHPSLAGQTIKVPAGSTAFWATKGWA